MITAAKFEKVSFEVFEQSCASLGIDLSHDELLSAYNDIKLPARATAGSAGYDFYSPFDVTIKRGEVFVFPTGIRCKMNEGWVLIIAPRSGIGFKTGSRLANTVGVIDQDYYFSDNEGHIMVKLVNEGALSRDLTAAKGTAFCQGILLPFGIAEGDDANATRNGGFGSSGQCPQTVPM